MVTRGWGEKDKRKLRLVDTEFLFGMMKSSRNGQGWQSPDTVKYINATELHTAKQLQR